MNKRVWRRHTFQCPVARCSVQCRWGTPTRVHLSHYKSKIRWYRDGDKEIPIQQTLGSEKRHWFCLFFFPFFTYFTGQTKTIRLELCIEQGHVQKVFFFFFFHHFFFRPSESLITVLPVTGEHYHTKTKDWVRNVPCKNQCASQCGINSRNEIHGADVCKKKNVGCRSRKRRVQWWRPSGLEDGVLSALLPTDWPLGIFRRP